jgi:hypothetical protein
LPYFQAGDFPYSAYRGKESRLCPSYSLRQSKPLLPPRDQRAQGPQPQVTLMLHCEAICVAIQMLWGAGGTPPTTFKPGSQIPRRGTRQRSPDLM